MILNNLKLKLVLFICCRWIVSTSCTCVKKVAVRDAQQIFTYSECDRVAFETIFQSWSDGVSDMCRSKK